MKRFRHRRSLRREAQRSRLCALRERLEAGWTGYWKRELEGQWTDLHRLCTDRASRARLARLIDALAGHDRGALESALAELELATLLARAGFSVAFLPELQSKTADLECALRRDRVLVEVTALVGSARRACRARPIRERPREDDEAHGGGHLLINRLLARIAQKARQLEDPSLPVLLAITVPHRDDRVDEINLRQLAGAVTVLLPRVNQISAVVLSLWDVEPSPVRSGVRLSNVRMIERSAQQAAYPRVRLLIGNPAAMYPLSGPVLLALQGLL